MRIVGICGRSGCGKSTSRSVLEGDLARLHGLRIQTIDADRVAHDCYGQNTQLLAELVYLFGPEIINPATGEIARDRLSKIVFSDARELAKLNRAVWPVVHAELQKQITRFSSDTGSAPDVLLIEAAVLVEAGWYPMFDEVWVVCVEPEIAANRAAGSVSGHGRDAFLKKIKNRHQYQLAPAAALKILEEARVPGVLIDNNLDAADNMRLSRQALETLNSRLLLLKEGLGIKKE